LLRFEAVPKLLLQTQCIVILNLFQDDEPPPVILKRVQDDEPSPVILKQVQDDER
jgi:hypothetical protein